jgi:hypothetical protein
MKFRSLKSEEVECRVGIVKENGLSLLLYKDARCDMSILDETVGCLNWTREHKRENQNCVVSVYCDDKKQWVSKEDTGAESFTEKEKGLASDSFKRACFNWGIGRELYTSPFIWVKNTGFIYDTGKKNTWNKPVYSTKEKFKVYHFVVKDGIISELGIKDSKENKVFRIKIGDK